MKAFFAFVQKEVLELVRSGRLTVLTILFLLLGIMNPAIAKLTPWLMELMADSLADTGLVVTQVQVDAMTSWVQFFKNIPMGLIAFVLLNSSSFTREYQSGTLVLVLTRGLARYKVVLAKFTVMLSLWTLGCWLCFAVTYCYNAYFWENSIAANLIPAAACWWLLGAWVIALMVLCSVCAQSSSGVLLGTGGAFLAVYLLGLLPKVKAYTPAMLMDSASLLYGLESAAKYGKAIGITLLEILAFLLFSVPILNKKRL